MIHTLHAARLAVLALITVSALAAPTAGQEELTGEYRQSWALLIGVNNSPGMETLNGVGDAEKMRAALVRLGFPAANVKVLRNPKADDIRHHLYYAFPQMDKNDRYIVFFSGHGHEFQRPDGVSEGYLLATDTKLESLHTTAIPMNDLKNIGQRIAAKHVLFILDACFSGLAITKGDDQFRSAPREVKPLLRNRVVQILAAGTGEQKAYQVANQGIFTKWVVAGLQFIPENEPGKALTFTGLASWVRDEVTRDSGGRLVPQPDRPVGVGEFVLRFPTASATSTAAEPSRRSTSPPAQIVTPPQTAVAPTPSQLELRPRPSVWTSQSFCPNLLEVLNGAWNDFKGWGVGKATLLVEGREWQSKLAFSDPDGSKIVWLEDAKHPEYRVALKPSSTSAGVLAQEWRDLRGAVGTCLTKRRIRTSKTEAGASHWYVEELGPLGVNLGFIWVWLRADSTTFSLRVHRAD